MRSASYSGGASIDIYWTDGPTDKQVSQVVAPFRGSDFDGMIDMKHSVRSWLLPDGSAAFGQSAGTEGSMGTHAAYDNAKPHPEARLVHFSADYVFTHREISPAFEAACAVVWETMDGQLRCDLINAVLCRWDSISDGKRLALATDAATGAVPREPHLRLVG